MDEGLLRRFADVRDLHGRRFVLLPEDPAGWPRLLFARPALPGWGCSYPYQRSHDGRQVIYREARESGAYGAAMEAHLRDGLAGVSPEQWLRERREQYSFGGG